jgi:hypothetical protein
MKMSVAELEHGMTWAGRKIEQTTVPAPDKARAAAARLVHQADSQELLLEPTALR